MSISNVKNLGSKPGSRPWWIKQAISNGLTLTQCYSDQDIVREFTVKDGEGKDKLMLTWINIIWDKLNGGNGKIRKEVNDLSYLQSMIDNSNPDLEYELLSYGS